MKFVSWNVNGLRACIQKGFLEQFDRFDADFFCLQEIKLSEGQLELELPGYYQYWCYAEKKGYSGTAIFTKHAPLSVHYGLDVPELDNEGRLITLEYPEFYLVTCYTPNAQRELARIDHRMRWDEAFRDYLQRLDSVKPVILCGDLNVAHKEIDLKNPASNRGNAGFSDQERESFQSTLDLGFTDTFRHLHPDTTGAYSWWSYMFKAREKNAGWRIDYFLVSNRLADSIHRADIHSQILGSDHCPVSLDLSLICNGGIWSPMQQGNACLVSPATTENSEPKASAVPAKALIAIAAAFVLLLTGLLLWPVNTALPEETSLFRVHIYTEPITHVYKEITYPSQSLIAQTHQFTDGECIYYSMTKISEDDLAGYNTWLRVEALQPLHMAALDFNMPDSISYQVECLQYYTDQEYTDFGGWLLFFSLPEDVTCTLTVHSDTDTQSETVSLYCDADSPLSFFQFPKRPDVGSNNDHLLYYSYHDYYCPITLGSANIESANFFLAVTPNTHILGDVDDTASIEIYAVDPSPGTVYTRMFRSYYNDAEYYDFGGWIIFGTLNKPTDFVVTVTVNGVTHSSVVTITPIGYSSADMITQLEDALVATTYFRPLQLQSSTGTTMHITDEAGTLQLHAHYNANLLRLDSYNSWFLLELSEYARMLLSDIDCSIFTELTGGNGQDNSLYITEVYSDSACTESMGWLVYGNLETTLELRFDLFIGDNSDRSISSLSYIPSPYLSPDAVMQLTTEELIHYVLTYKAIRNQLAEPESIYPSEHPALTALANRDDAVELLMNMDLAWIGNGKNLAMSLLTALKDRMTPLQEARMITLDYPNCPIAVSHTDLDYDPEELAGQPTEVILTRMMMTTSISELLDQCSCPESAYHVFLYVHSRSAYLQELMTRQDATEIIHTTLDMHLSEDSLYCYWDYITARLAAEEMTTEALLDTISTYADQFQDLSVPLKEYCQTDANLTTLLERDDAIDLLINADPNQTVWSRDMIQSLLSLLHTNMTPNQAARYITGLYAGSSREFTFSMDTSTPEMSTDELVVELENNGETLYLLLCSAYQFDDPDAVLYELHELLLPYSNILQTLATRRDAIPYLRMAYWLSRSMISPVGMLLRIYEQYPEIYGGNHPASDDPCLLDASQYLTEDQRIDYVALRADSIGSFYAAAADFSVPLYEEAEFAYFITVPQNLTSSYSWADLELRLRVIFRGDIPEKNYTYVIPCYTDTDCAWQCGWLIYGTIGEDNSLLLQLIDGNNYSLCYTELESPIYPDATVGIWDWDVENDITVAE